MVECGESDKQGRRIAVLLFKHEDLIYDIANMAFVEGHIMVDADDEIRHTIQDIAQEGNRDRVERVLDTAHAIITELLYPYTKEEIRRAVVDSRLPRRHVIGIRLEIPNEFSQTTLNLLERLVFEYFVCDVLQDWLSVTNPQKSVVWKDKREEIRVMIRRCVTNRRGNKRVRIRQHPF